MGRGGRSKGEREGWKDPEREREREGQEGEVAGWREGERERGRESPNFKEKCACWAGALATEGYMYIRLAV